MNTGYQNLLVVRRLGIEEVTNTIDIPVSKTWSDNSNAYGNRPSSITVKLYKDDVDTGKSLTLNSSNGWSGTFTDLEDDTGYTVKETSVPAGYSASYSGNQSSGFTITNTLKTTSVKVTKKWDDNNNQDDLREQVTVTLYETIDGTKSVSKDASGNTRTGILSTTDGSTYTFSNLPTHRNGKAITYTVEETVPDEYTASYSENGTSNVTITNTYVPKTDIKVNKQWNDDNNRDRERPDSVNVTLFANGVEQETVELNSSNSWSHTFTDLPENKDGSAITYTIKETTVPDGYTAEVEGSAEKGFVVINTYDPETTEVKVTKVWDDEEDAAGLRSDAVTVVLIANGVATNKTVTLNEENDWTATFTDIYKYENGEEIEYTVREAEETDVYTHVEGTTTDNGYVIEDANGNQFVWVEVPKDTTVYSSSTLNLDLDSLTGTELTDAYDAIEKDLQNYTSAFRVEGYSDTHSGNDTAANLTSEEYTSLKQRMLKSIFKNGGFYVGRYETGIEGSWRTEGGDTTQTPVIKQDAYPYNFVTLRQAQSLASSFAAAGYESSLMFGIQWDLMLKYLQTKGVSEEDLLKNSINWGNTRSLEHNITSTTAKYSLDFGITWSSTPFNKTAEDRIILTTGADSLFYKQNISDLAGNEHEMTLEYSSEGGSHITRGSYHGSQTTWKVNNSAARQNIGLDKGNDGKGFRVALFKSEDISYVSDQYTSTIEGDAETGFTITNKYVPTKIDLEVKKEWADYENRDGIRPSSVTVTLYKNEIATEKTVTLDESNGWTAKFEGLYEYEDGKKVEYTVQEDVPDGYIADIERTGENQTTITNRHTPERIDIDVTKVWEGDDDNAYETRPGHIEVILCKNGTVTDNSIILSADSNWTGTFTDLYKYENGKQIEYTIQEVEVKDYTTHITGNVSIGFTITNTLKNKPIPEGIVITNKHVPEKVNITVKKEWNDQNDLDDLRKPITITLYEKTVDDDEPRVSRDADGNARTLTLTEPNWEGTFENLYKYEYRGKLITYSVKEEPLYTEENARGEIPYDEPSYEREEDDKGNVTIKITNTHEPYYDGYKEITGIVWMDGAVGKSNDIDGVLTDKDTLVEEGKVKIRLLDGEGNPIPSAYSDKDGNLTRTDYAEPSSTDGTYTIRINYDNSKNVYKLYDDKATVEAKLENAYVEFEYDGMKYTTVKNAATGADTSKAVENETQRNTFDGNHYEVEIGTQHPDKWEDRNITAVTNGILTYTKGKDITRNEVIKYCHGNGTYDRTKYDNPTVVQENLKHTCEDCLNEGHTKDEWKFGVTVETIPNINLGLFEREQPQVGINEELTKVEVVMNDQKYTYLYGVKNTNIENENSDDDDYMKAKFQNKYTYTYRRPVNPADIEYAKQVDSSHIEVYVTYEIKVANLSPTLLVYIDEIVNLYDPQYTIVSIKKGDAEIPEANRISENVYSSSGFNQIKLTGLNICLEGEREASSNDTIKIKYKIAQEQLPELVNNKSPLNNAVEIIKYSTRYGEKTLYAEQGKGGRTENPYGGYDYESHPGNANMYIDSEGRINSDNLEYDADIAPAFVLEKDSKGTKTLAGTVWEDTKSDEIEQEEKERLGNGYQDDSENKVKDVRIELLNRDGTLARRFDESGTEITNNPIYSGGDGNYTIPGVVTGEYFIRYIYGNDESELGTKTTIGETEVNARNYKSTIITNSTIKYAMGRDYDDSSFDKKWHLRQIDRYSVAVDDMKERTNIGDLTNATYSIGESINAYTKPFETQVEFEIAGLSQVDENGNNDKLTNVLSSLDFGIIERPREDLIVNKTISYFKISLANGQILTEGNPSDTEADISYAKTMGFRKINSVKEARTEMQKRVLVEMDVELIQASQLEVSYEVTVINNNEIDYDYGSESDYGDIRNNEHITTSSMASYYYYGDKGTLNEMEATIEFVDYLDQDLVYKEDLTKWTQVNVNDLKNGGLISDDVKNVLDDGEYRMLQSVGGSITLKRGYENKFTQSMSVSKLLANQEENAFDNHAEIIRIDGKTARTVKAKDEEEIQLEYIPGDYIPSYSSPDQPDDDKVDIIVTPPTGITSYIIYVIIALTGLIVISIVVIFIKKKVLLK